jgi:hypothetical protein
MAIYDPALMQAAGFDPFATIDDLRSRVDIQNDAMDPRLFEAAGLDPYAKIDEVRSGVDIQRQQITFASLGVIAAIVSVVYILFGDGFR